MSAAAFTSIPATSQSYLIIPRPTFTPAVSSIHSPCLHTHLVASCKKYPHSSSQSPDRGNRPWNSIHPPRYYSSSPSRPSSALDAAASGTWSSGSNSGNDGRNNNNNKNNFGNNNDDQADDNSNAADPVIVSEAVQQLLKSKNRTLASFPTDIIQALSAGVMSESLLVEYLKVEASLLGFFLTHIKGFRDRFLADRSFLFKLLVQEVVGNGMQLIGEVVVRGREIFDELEYVASDLIIGTVLEAAFVWFLTPSIPFPSLVKPSTNPITAFLQALPASAFEAATPQRTFSLLQRVLAFFHVGAQYMAVGYLSGIIGTAITYALIKARSAADPKYKPIRSLPPVLENSWGFAVFMGISANPRFQLCEGIERLIGILLATKPALLKFLITCVRFTNNYVGGIQFIMIMRWLGIQETSH